MASNEDNIYIQPKENNIKEKCNILRGKETSSALSFKSLHPEQVGLYRFVCCTLGF